MRDSLETDAPDILARIQGDFGAESEEAIHLIKGFWDEMDAREPLRILRSVIFISTGNVENLVYYIQAAKKDWRDVIWWAEYYTASGEKSEQRLRDFSQAFGEEEM